MAKHVNIYEKPLSHINLPDWYARQWELRQSADARRAEARQLRNSGKITRSERNVRTEWDTYMNNARLADRVTELIRWRNEFEQLLQKLLGEIQSLRNEKANTEKEIENINYPLRVISECLSIRDSRRETELTYDEANAELRKELRLIENVRDTYTKRVQAAWEKLNRLERIRFELCVDLEDKNETIEIDRENLDLDNTGANITFKPKILFSKKTGCITYEVWLDRCRCFKKLIDDELNDCYNFCEETRVMRECALNDIQAQQDATDYTLRKRIYETQKARNELEWQKLKMHKEMEKLEKEINQLERALICKTDVIKCAETRLEKRNYRPGYELCTDQVDLGLRKEILQLKQTEEDLVKAIEHAKTSYNDMESLFIRINKNLEDKQHSLNTDVMCLDTRVALKTGDKTRLSNETNRNIVLTHMEKEIPLET